MQNSSQYTMLGSNVVMVGENKRKLIVAEFSKWNIELHQNNMGLFHIKLVVSWGYTETFGFASIVCAERNGTEGFS